jgi:type I restriction enzyme S subunit
VGRGTESDVRSGKTSFRNGDVLFGKLRPYLRKSVLVDKDGICSTDILVFRATEKCIPEFICLLTHTDEFVGHAKATTSGVQHPRTSWSGLREFKLHVPPIPEQRKIVGVLGVVQRAMEQHERLLALTAELKKALLHQLFTAGLRGEPQKQTDIGHVPKSWDMGMIGDVAKIQSGGTPTRDVPENWRGGTIPWVKTGEIDYRTIQTTEERITPVGLANSAARLFPAGTLLMAMYGQGVTRGRVAVLGIEATTNQACASITPHDESKVSSPFLYYFLEYHYENLRKLGHGANQRNMNAALIRGFPVAYPSGSEQAEIVSALSAFDAKQQIRQRKHTTLIALFRTLLHQLMTAQIRVHDLDLPELPSFIAEDAQ